MVPSIRVACLIAYCVLIGSLAELLFSFCMQNVLEFLQMVDATTGKGKVMSSMVIALALKVHCDTYHHGLAPRTRSCSGLLSLLYSTAPDSD